MERTHLHAALVLLLGLYGCTSAGQNLTPAPRANAVAGQPSTAEETDGRTHITVAAEEWPGEARITEEVTPLKVTIRNGGEHALRLTYDSFALQGSAETYAAIPPFEVDGTVDAGSVLAGARWHHHGFWAAPYYGAYHPHAVLYTTRVGVGPDYYDDHYAIWDQTQELPTPEMLSWALPEGVIDPGGAVSGYLYFERVDDHEEEVQFRAWLKDIHSEMEVVNVSIPFMVVD